MSGHHLIAAVEVNEPPPPPQSSLTKPPADLDETDSTSFADTTSTNQNAKSETDSPSPLPNVRSSIERSPRTVPSKPTLDRRSLKTVSPAEKPAPRGVSKGSELQAQITALQEDLKKAEEKLVSVEKEKAKAINELKEAQKLSEDTNEKVSN